MPRSSQRLQYPFAPASLGYRLAPRNDYNTLSPLRRSADGSIGMTANKIIALVVRLFFLMF